MSVPTTPRHSRQSTLDDPALSPIERRPSTMSHGHDLATPTHHLHPSYGQGDAMDVFSSGGVGLGGVGGVGNGLGNLADELADAYSDDDDEGEYYGDEYTEDDLQLGSAVGAPAPGIDVSAAGGDAFDVGDASDAFDDDVPAHASAHASSTDATLNVPAASGASGGHAGTRRGHKRAGSAYDGSEYGSDSDLEASGMPTGLVAKMDAVESLARRGTEDNGGPGDGVCQRLTEALRDLGSQAGVEGGASRLITAHSALTTHLTHQTRQLHALAFPLFTPLASAAVPVGVALTHNHSASTSSARSGSARSGSARSGHGAGIRSSNFNTSTDDEDDDDNDDDNDADSEDELLPMLASLASQMPRPSTAAYQSLAALQGLTGDLVATLNYLSDTLHMARQTTNTATRRLRSAKELVAEMRRDEELREQGERWLARGNWNERLQRRECAHVCGDVVGGFEEVCNGWRARLLAQAEASQATA